MSSSPDLTRRLIVLLLLIAVCGLWLPSHAWADGTQTGIIAGTVVDSGARALPSVQVVLQGPDGRRSSITNEAGRFRFPALKPGVYGIQASLLSLGDRQDGLAVYIGRTTQTTLELVESDPVERNAQEVVFPGPSESVQVVALAPLVDPLDTRVRSVVRREFLDVLPLERFYQSVALLLPDVAGGADGNPNVGGALRSNNLFLVDGVDTTDQVTGLFGLNLAYEAIESVEVVTAGMPPELGRASGAVINVVTRSSDGNHRGTVRWIVDPDSGSADYRPHSGPDRLSAEIAAVNSGTGNDQTIAATLGGPLLKSDRAWYFAAGQEGDSTSLRPTLIGDRWNAGVAIDANLLRVGWRLADNHTFNAQYTSDSATTQAFLPFLAAAENTTDKPPTSDLSAQIAAIPGDLPAISSIQQSGSFGKLDWNVVAGPSWTASASIAIQDRTLKRAPGSRSGVTGDALHADITRLVEGFDPETAGDLFFDDIFSELSFYNGLTDVGEERRPRNQGGFSLGWFKGGKEVDHDLSLGFDILNSESETDLRLSGVENIDPFFGTPAVGQLYFDLLLTDPCIAGGPCSSFNSTDGTFSPYFLLNTPARKPVRSRSDQMAIYVSDAITFGPWLVDIGLRWDHQEAEQVGGRNLVSRNLASHQGFAPRLGVKYDAKGDGSTLYSLNVGRYFEPFPQGFLDGFFRPDAFSGASLYRWDTDVDPSCVDADPEIDSPCWFFAGSFFNDPLQFAPLDESLRRTRMDEVVIGFERRLGSSIGLHLHLLHRDWSDLWDDVLFFNEGDGNIDGVRNIAEAERQHQSLRLLIQKRFANHWQMLASITRSKTEGNLFSREGDATFFDFRDLSDANQINRFGPAPYDRPNQIHLFALYELPLKRVALTFGSSLFYESGTPWQAVRENPELGALVFLDPRGSRRLDDRLQWDLSLNASIETGTDLDLLAKLEIFNVFDEQTQIGVETDVDLPGFGQPRSLADLQAPRRLRFSIELRF